MSRPILATIHLANLRHNHGVIRSRVGGAKIWSVIKANGYGHGMLEVARALAPDTDGFALLGIDGAVRLRRDGITQPVLLLEGFFGDDELPVISEHGFLPVLHRMDQVRSVVAAGLPLSVYLKINTGMNRLGIAPAELPQALALLRAAPHISQITLMTHFADADGGGVSAQLAVFSQAVHGHDLPLSLANSASLLRFPETHGAAVRPGLVLFGASPMPHLQTAEQLGLKPVMTLQSELIAERSVNPGDAVGYGATFTADRPMRMGVVACGYADGYPRHAASGTPILVGGVRTQTLGRVSMDMMAVDLTPVPHATVGTPVVLWGEGMPVDEVAQAAGTISYELLTALARRVPMKFVGA